MKSTFTLNTHIATALNGYDLPKLINAIQASLNSAVETKEESRRGNVKLVSAMEDGEKIKNGAFRFNESTSTQYTGKTDAPARFARWHDSIATVFKKAGEPSGQLTVAIVPAGLKVWLDDKFTLVPAPETPAENTGNGKPRKGGIKSVPAPAAPTA